MSTLRQTASALLFALGWLLVTSLAYALGRAALLMLRSPWDVLLMGALIGTLQWSLLPQRMPGSGWWIAATAAGHVAVAWALPPTGLILTTLVTGAAVGLLQWRVLRGTVRWAGWWVLMRLAAAWPAAAVAMAALAHLVPLTTILAGHMMAGALQGAVIGAITGPSLALLLRAGATLSAGPPTPQRPLE